MRGLVLTESKQPLAPVEITVAEQFVAGGRIDEDVEVRKITRSITQGVGRIYDHQGNQ